MARHVATLIARAFNILKAEPAGRFTPEYIAGITGMDPEQAGRACARLVKAGCALLVGVSNCGDPQYQFVEGSEKPADRRGKHGRHLSGVAWAMRRKQRANLVKARAARKSRARPAAVVLGVNLG